jgi:uncharacterized protein (DUF2147 family)
MQTNIKRRPSVSHLSGLAWPAGLALLLIAHTSAAATEVIGRWLTSSGGVVQIDPCGTSVCGRIVSAPELAARPDQTDVKNKDPAERTRPLRGLIILSGFHQSGDAWAGGWIYDPHVGSTYKSTMEPLDPRTLKVTGCVAGVLCQSQTWTRRP